MPTLGLRAAVDGRRAVGGKAVTTARAGGVSTGRNSAETALASSFEQREKRGNT